MKHKKDIDYPDETTFLVAVETDEELSELINFLERNNSINIEEKIEFMGEHD